MWLGLARGDNTTYAEHEWFSRLQTLAPISTNLVPSKHGELRLLLPAAHLGRDPHSRTRACGGIAIPPPVKIQLRKAALDRQPAFWAFSYTWGDAAARTNILVGEQATLSITQSLEAALKAMRTPDEPVFLWVDQICINQDDSHEKTSQLPLMGRIYSLATQTVAWLGEGTPNSDLTMEYLRQVGAKGVDIGLVDLTPEEVQALFAEEADVASGIVRRDKSMAAMKAAVHDLIREQGDFFSLPALDGMAELCLQAFFTRGWIQQEVAIPKKLMLKWGGTTIDASLFAAAIIFQLVYATYALRTFHSFQVADYHEETREMAQRTASGNAQLMHIHGSLAIRSRYHSGKAERYFNMAYLVKRYGRLDFSRPEDRVCGVLGLANDCEQLGLTVDATMPWERIFADTAKRIVQKKVAADDWVGGINFLSFSQFLEPVSPLPSWVPDLRSIGGIHALNDETFHLSKPFNASCGASHSITDQEQHSADNGVLLCGGIVVDRVAEVGRLWGTDRDQHGKEISHGALTPLADISDFATKSAAIVSSDSSSRHPYRARPQRLLEAEWRVPVLDLESVSTATSTISRRATAVSQEGYDGVKFLMTLDRDSDSPRKLLQNLPFTESEKEKLMQVPAKERKFAAMDIQMAKATAYAESVEQKTYNIHLAALKERKPFLGEKGFVGVGPPSMQAGDLVCVIYGGSYPFVLRRVAGAEPMFQLIGQAYCDGIMDGEALQMGISYQEFRLV